MKTKLKKFFNNIFLKIPDVIIVFLIAAIFHIHFKEDTLSVSFYNEKEIDYHLIKSYLKSLFPDGEFFIDENDSAKLSKVYDKDKNLIGYFLRSSPYCDGIKGYAGTVPFIIGVDLEDAVLGIELLGNSEKPAVLDYISEKGFFESWNGLSLNEVKNHEIDAVTGATVTASAIIQSMKKRTAILETEQIPDVEFKLNIRFWAVNIFVLAGLFCFLFPKQTIKYRRIYLITDILIIGIFFNIFLSLDYFINLTKNGIIFIRNIGIIAIISLVLPLLTNKNFYCSHICPYGAMQELVSGFSKRKITLPKKLVKFLLKFRWFYITGLLALVFTGFKIDLSEFEPFAVFNYRFVSFRTIVFAVFFLFISYFITRFWCGFICPTGRIMEFIQRPCCKSLKNISIRLAVIILLTAVIVFKIATN